MYAALAPETPAVYSSPVDAQARTNLDEAYARSAEHFLKYGEAGLMEAIRAEPGRGAPPCARTRIARQAAGGSLCGERRASGLTLTPTLSRKRERERPR
jgi:hypothetical protein